MAFDLFVRFALCVTALNARTVVGKPVASSPANSLHDAQSGCIWECNVVGSEFGLEMKALISEYRLITLHLKYEQQVVKKCVNQTDANNSSIKLAELWTWWTGAENPSRNHGGQNISQPSNSNKDSVTSFRKSLEGQIEVGVLCSFKPTKDLNGTQPSLNDLITMELMEEVVNFAPELSYSDTVLCYKLSAKNGSFVCINITTRTAYSIHVSWQQHGFKILAVVISFVSLWYFPAIVCLFAPTEVKTPQGRVNIVLGTSPVSIRSWIANKLSSHADSIKLKLILPLIFLVFSIGFMVVEKKVIDLVLPPPSMLGDSTQSLTTRVGVLLLSNTLLLIRCAVKLLWSKLSFGMPCLICHVFGNKQGIIHDQENPEYYGRNEIKMHLRIQPSIAKGLFVRYCSFLKLATLVCLSGRLCCTVRWLVLVLLALLLSPVYLVVVAIVLVHSCPLPTFFDMLVYQSRAYRRNPRFGVVGVLQLSIVVWALFFIVVEIAKDTVTIFRGSLMRLPNYLPYASLGVVIAYCIWKCYISLPRNYNNLALKLYKHYKAETATETQGGDKKPFHHTQNYTREIPKDLFVEAREKLMPLRESAGILVVWIVAILAGVFVVFAVIMETPGADDVTKACGTLLALLIPKISEMFFDVDSQVKELDDETFDMRVKSVVNEYLLNLKTDKTVANQNASNNNNGGISAENEGDQELNSSNEITQLLPCGASKRTETQRTDQGQQMHYFLLQ